MINATLTLEERALLKSLDVSSKRELIEKLESIEIEDDFTKEFINDLIKKIED